MIFINNIELRHGKESYLYQVKENQWLRLGKKVNGTGKLDNGHPPIDYNEAFWYKIPESEVPDEVLEFLDLMEKSIRKLKG
jgi:hypothetical protein